MARSPRSGRRTSRTTGSAPADDQQLDRYAFTAVMRHRKLVTEMGWFGRVFGSAKNAPINAAGFTLLVTLTVGTVATFALPAGERFEVWKYVTPIITLALGYAFGKKT